MPTILKRIYASADEIPETFKTLYVEQDGKHVLDANIEGLVPSKKVDEMRETNVRERQAHEEALARFKDIDPDKYHDLLTREKDLTDGKLVKKGGPELEAVLAPRLEQAVAPLKEELKKSKGNEAVLRDRLEKAIIENQVVQAALPLGLRKGAAPDLIERARKIFKLNDEGEVVAYNPDGKTIRYHLGTEPYTLDIFAKELANDENGKHLFEPNQGGGGEARRGGGGGDNGVNPWNPATTNRTTQGEIMQKDFPRAQRLALVYGIKLKPLV